MEDNQEQVVEITIGQRIKRWLLKKKKSYVDDIKTNPECHGIIYANVVYFLLFVCCDMWLLNRFNDVEVIGLIFLFRLICFVAFIFFAVKLRKISYDNRGWAKWLLIISLFAIFVTFGACVGYHWGQLADLIAELPLLAISIYIIVKHRKDERGY